MFVVRAVQAGDAAALEALAAVATPGVHTLPKSREAIERAIEHSIASFGAHVDLPSEESYMFVLESCDDGRLQGTASIAATAGSQGTFFAFRNDVIQQVSRDLNISHSVHALTLCSDLTGHSQLSSFYMRDWHTAGQEAALLSRARLLFAASAAHRFSDRFFASLAGVTDNESRSPFWEALGRKFFHMDFLEVERLIEGARNRSLIIELMPHYPVYVPLLPGEAQAAMGQVHAEGELPFHILSDEGFEPDEFIDIFDGGPILQAHKNSLRAFSSSLHLRALAADAAAGTNVGASYLVSTARNENFRAVVMQSPLLEQRDDVALSAEAMRALDLVSGDPVLCVRL
ncbi:MAG TPA: arginine N-succinyltransferase [Burkholderiaceae bacterium]